MNSSMTSIPETRVERADPHYFGVPTEELLLDLSWIRQCRLDAIEDPELEDSTREHTIQYWDCRADRLVREVKRRHDQHLRFEGTAYANHWPSSKSYEKTLQMAHELKRAIPLSSYIYYTLPAVQLKRSGPTWKGRCPYPDHSDDSPSFTVYDEVRFKCFGCGRSGDVFSLVAMIDGLDRFSDQVASLRSWAGMVASS